MKHPVQFAVWCALVSLVIAWLIAEHSKMSVALISCQKQLSRSQADINALAAHRIELDAKWRSFANSLNLAVGE
jgi:Tfp pilus assembly protein PilN